MPSPDQVRQVKDRLREPLHWGQCL